MKPIANGRKITDYTDAYDENLRGHDLVADRSDVYIIKNVYEDTVYTQGKGDVLYPFIQLESLLTGRTMSYWKVNGPTRKYILACGFNDLSRLVGMTVQVYYQHIKVHGSNQGYMTVYPNRFIGNNQQYPVASPPSMGLDREYDNRKVKTKFLADAKYAFEQAGKTHPVHGSGKPEVKKQTPADIKRVIGATSDLYGIEDKDQAIGEALRNFAGIDHGTESTLSEMPPEGFAEFKTNILSAWKSSFDACKSSWVTMKEVIGDDEEHARIFVEAFGENRQPKTLSECRSMHQTKTAQKHLQQIVGIIESQPNYNEDSVENVLGTGVTEITNLFEASDVLNHFTSDLLTSEPLTENDDVLEVEF